MDKNSKMRKRYSAVSISDGRGSTGLAIQCPENVSARASLRVLQDFLEQEGVPEPDYARRELICWRIENHVGLSPCIDFLNSNLKQARAEHIRLQGMLPLIRLTHKGGFYVYVVEDSSLRDDKIDEIDAFVQYATSRRKVIKHLGLLDVRGWSIALKPGKTVDDLRALYWKFLYLKKK